MIFRLIEKGGDFLIMACVAFIFGLLKLLTFTNKPIKFYFVSIATSVPVGTLVGVLALEFHFGDISSMAISSLCSLLAHDLVMGILNHRKFIGDLLKRAAENLTDRLTK